MLRQKEKSIAYGFDITRKEKREILNRVSSFQVTTKDQCNCIQLEMQGGRKVGERSC